MVDFTVFPSRRTLLRIYFIIFNIFSPNMNFNILIKNILLSPYKLFIINKKHNLNIKDINLL